MPILENVQLLPVEDIPLPDGSELENVDEIAKGIVRSYDPVNSHEAPVILGHESDDPTKLPKHDGVPAFGWVEDLDYRPGKGLYSKFKISDELAEWIDKEYYKKLSLSFYPEDSPMNPTPGTPYIRHVALLGASPPVVKGLESYTSLGEEGDGGFVYINLDEQNFNIVKEEKPAVMELNASDWLRIILSEGVRGYKDTIASFNPEPSPVNGYLTDEGRIKGQFVNNDGYIFDFLVYLNEEGSYVRQFAPANPAEMQSRQDIERGLSPSAYDVAVSIAEKQKRVDEPLTGVKMNIKLETTEQDLVDQAETKEVQDLSEPETKDLSEGEPVDLGYKKNLAEEEENYLPSEEEIVQEQQNLNESIEGDQIIEAAMAEAEEKIEKAEEVYKQVEAEAEEELMAVAKKVKEADEVLQAVEEEVAQQVEEAFQAADELVAETLSEEDDIASQLEAMQAMINKLKESNRILLSEKKENLERDIFQFSEHLYKEGKLTSGIAPKEELESFLVALSELDTTESVVSLSEKGGKQDLLGWSKRLLSNLPSIVELGELSSEEPKEEKSTPTSIAGHPVDPDSDEIHQKVLQLCEKRKIDPNTNVREYLNIVKEVTE